MSQRTQTRPEPMIAPPVRGERLLTLKQAMDRLGVRETKFYEIRREPDFPVVRVGNKIREADLDEYIRQRPADPVAIQGTR